MLNGTLRLVIWSFDGRRVQTSHLLYFKKYLRYTAFEDDPVSRFPYLKYHTHVHLVLYYVLCEKKVKGSEHRVTRTAQREERVRHVSLSPAYTKRSFLAAPQSSELCTTTWRMPSSFAPQCQSSCGPFHYRHSLMDTTSERIHEPTVNDLQVKLCYICLEEERHDSALI